jgi:hypothetical protein
MRPTSSAGLAYLLLMRSRVAWLLALAVLLASILVFFLQPDTESRTEVRGTETPESLLVDLRTSVMVFNPLLDRGQLINGQPVTYACSSYGERTAVLIGEPRRGRVWTVTCIDVPGHETGFCTPERVLELQSVTWQSR